MNRIQPLRKTALLAGLFVLPLVNQSYGAAIVGLDPKTTITATMDGGTAKTGNTWYERGVNGASNTTGLATGVIAGQSDPLSTYLFQPAKGNNALLLDTGAKSGTLTLTRPISVTALSLSGASGNGTGTNVLTLHYSDGTSGTLAPLAFGDWFGNTNRVATSHGRIDAGANVFNNVGDDNPRVLAVNTALPLADQSKFITSIDLSWTGSGANTHTAIFGISGDIAGLGHYSALNVTGFNQDVIVGLSEVPEPGTLALLGVGAVAFLAAQRRKRA